ncbi:Ankyrin repeat-containing protein [Variovorax sp. CF079]|uniref:ankyrin repeat domain-containing protein n=1 Tax=Variovorax sp. CF079 TaxID=1882774 RepID=UPI0008904A71|nr:ankyrin repeat domain-containing protein [Variovorax sp. CF079]SDE51102.1 Ankyrin repeat-containing protein [Variovorax sp. CF079]
MNATEVSNEVRKALYEAVSAGDLRTIHEMHRSCPRALEQGWTGGDSPGYLHLAARKGQLAVCELLIELGLDVNRPAASSGGSTPLEEAATAGHLSTVRFLIEAGAWVDGPAESASTPLMGAAMEGYVEIAQLLVDAGADIHREHLRLPQTALDFASLYAMKGGGQAAVAEYLRGMGAQRPYLERHDWSDVPQQPYIEHIERSMQGFANPRALALIDKPDGTSVILRAIRIPAKYEFQLIFSAGLQPGKTEVGLILPSSWPLNRASLQLPLVADPIARLSAVVRAGLDGQPLHHGALLTGEQLPLHDTGSRLGPWVLSLHSALEAEREGDTAIAQTLLLVPCPAKKPPRTSAEAMALTDRLMRKPWKSLLFADAPS